MMKLQLLQVRCEDVVRRPDGSVIDRQSDLTYLGTIVHEDGREGRELSRRLGMARREFRALAQLWKLSLLGNTAPATSAIGNMSVRLWDFLGRIKRTAFLHWVQRDGILAFGRRPPSHDLLL